MRKVVWDKNGNLVSGREVLKEIAERRGDETLDAGEQLEFVNTPERVRKMMLEHDQKYAMEMPRLIFKALEIYEGVGDIDVKTLFGAALGVKATLSPPGKTWDEIDPAYIERLNRHALNLFILFEESQEPDPEKRTLPKIAVGVDKVTGRFNRDQIDSLNQRTATYMNVIERHVKALSEYRNRLVVLDALIEDSSNRMGFKEKFVEENTRWVKTERQLYFAEQQAAVETKRGLRGLFGIN